jgi:site-specific DNA-methyltransferase (adenine-specific)
MKIINGNNIDILKTYPDNYFDVAICYIEYGLGASSPSTKPSTVVQKNGKVLSLNNPIYPKSNWDTKRADQTYFDELLRVSKHQIIFGANYYSQLRGGMIVWDKLTGENDNFGCEIAYQSFSDRTDMVYYMWSGMMQGRYCGRDVKKALIQQGNKKLNEKRIHETQKPVILYEWLLDNYCKGYKRILDTNEGSGSLKIACYKKGFDYVGMENFDYHYHNAQDRFKAEISAYEKQKELLSRQLSFV